MMPFQVGGSGASFPTNPLSNSGQPGRPKKVGKPVVLRAPDSGFKLSDNVDVDFVKQAKDQYLSKWELPGTLGKKTFSAPWKRRQGISTGVASRNAKGRAVTDGW